jgi:hypothetical protein
MSAASKPGTDPAGDRSDRARALAWVSAALVIYAGLCKALLFRNLEYWSNDLFGFLELSWSWLYSGRPLHDNLYGNHAAIHNYYLLPLFAPLTLPFGAYGLFAVLIAVNLVVALRAAAARELDLTGRLAVLCALLGPLSYYVFDNPGTGFHIETCFPALAAWLALELVAGRPRAAALLVALIVLIKEDGPVLCFSVLTAFFAWRLVALRGAAPAARRRVTRRALVSLGAVTLVFLAGMALLHYVGERAPAQLERSTPRVDRSLRILELTVSGEARELQRRRLIEGTGAWAETVLLLLLPLGRRFPRGLGLFLLSAAPVLVVMAIASALYRFELMMWPPRLAPLTGLLLACVVVASSTPRRPEPAALTAALVLLSCGLQVVMLGGMGYRFWHRLDVVSLAESRGYVSSRVPPAELALVRCVARLLRAGLPGEVPRDLQAVFHRQSLVLEGLEDHAWHAPRLRVVDALAVGRLAQGACLGPRKGGLAIEAECPLIPLLAGCDQEPELRR